MKERKSSAGFWLFMIFVYLVFGTTGLIVVAVGICVLFALVFLHAWLDARRMWGGK